MNPQLTVFLLFLCIYLTNAGRSDSFVLMDIEAPGVDERRLCANYQQFPYKSVPLSREDAVAYPLRYWERSNNTNVCIGTTQSLANSIVPADYTSSTPKDWGECGKQKFTFFYITGQMRRLQEANAGAALFLVDPPGSPSDFHSKNYLFSRFYNPAVGNDTPVFYMYKEDFYGITGRFTADEGTFRFYRPADPFLDAGVFVLLAFAVGSISIGCIWYSIDLRRRLRDGEIKVDERGILHEHSSSDDHTGESNADRPTSTPNTTNTDVEQPQPQVPKQDTCCCGIRTNGAWAHLIYAVEAFVLVAGILLLSYFYRPMAVEFFNLFVLIGGTFSVWICAITLLRICIRDPVFPSFGRCVRLDSAEYRQKWYIPSCLYAPFRPFSVAVFLLAFGLTLFWRLNMNQFYAFALLDAINVCICIHCVKSSELRSLRLITFFLVAMFIYDIVMVFGTRLLTENGCSVMIQVVTGTDCTKVRPTDYAHDWPMAPVALGRLNTMPQKLPVLFYVPLLSNPVGHCYNVDVEGEYLHMMLGLGDVIAPGYLIAFAFYLDVRKQNRYHSYGLTALIGYTLGMVATFVSLKLMATAQPALIYLVPFTLIPLLLLCACRGTLKESWRGAVTGPPTPSSAEP